MSTEKDDKKAQSGISHSSHPKITPEHLRRNVAVYIRQSSKKQVEGHTGSTDVQRSLKNIALGFGWDESQVILIEEDLGRSGADTTERTGWRRMIDLIVSGSVKVVITANTSRLSRNLVDLLELLALAARNGVLLIVDGKITDPRDDNDIFFSRILGSIAEYENRIRAENMRRARFAKVRRGEVAMPLPVGFIKRADKTIAKDPEVKDIIDRTIQIFRETRSARRTLITLRQQGIKLPSKRGKSKILWKQPTIYRIYWILKNPAYSGTFAFGRSRVAPELGKTSTGRVIRRPVPEDQWIKFYNHLPAYMTVEEQEEILKTLKANDFGDKHRPGDGPALCQGRVVCGKCGAKLRVAYWDLRTSHSYRCCDAAVKWGDKICMKVPGRELDKAVERMVLQVLESPPIEILKQALREATRAEEIKAREMDAERQRIERRERLVRAQFDACDPKYKLVYDDLQEQLDAVLKDIKRMEERLQAERLRPKLEVTG